ncbi:MAG TPA: hypothetical protein VMZ73_00845 [Acidimicrobiales bacterium]|nr:hypothetical protein [Acidimicrobiales bacterium]
MADADPGVDVSPAGTVAFFLDTIAPTNSLGTCTLSLAGGLGGMSFCVHDLAVPSGPHTILANYIGGGPYSPSVGVDDVNNPPAGPPEPSETRGICAPLTAPGVAGPLQCDVLVTDDDSDVSPNPTGTVTFYLNAVSAPNQIGTCSLTLSGIGGLAVCGAPTVTAPVPAGASVVWAVYSGDGTFAPSSSATLPNPTIATQASAGGAIGTSVRDVATVTGGIAPTGTVTFRLFSESTCTVQTFTSTNNLTGSTATSDWFAPAATGTYYWTALYNGDASNNPAQSPCNAPNESVVISPFQSPGPTATLSGDVLGPVTVRSGQSVLITNARVVGPVTVEPGGALTVVNSSITRGVTANAPSFFSMCGSQVSGPSPATALSVTNAPVPIRVGDPANGCAGNRFAGQVVLSNNLAVTFGANAVSHPATINSNGPGNTVIKANTVFGTLACAGNNPPPTNAGQVNTAGTKTGQCAAL